MGFPYRKIKQAQSGLKKTKQSWVVDYWIKVMFSDESGLVKKVMLELLPEENKQISPLIHGMGVAGQVENKRRRQSLTQQ